KPYDFLWYQFSNSLGEMVFRGVANALFGGAIALWLVGPPPSLAGFVVVLPAIVGSWVLNFCAAALIGLAAFVVEDVTAFVWIYQKAAFILGGLLIPLDFYPGWLQAIAKALPFSSMVYAPAKLFIAPTPALFLNTLLLQSVWIAVLGLLLTLVYRRGLAQLTVNGG
ncbi:MAG TPA: ABC transporter permease, partial [Anaerolineales bacterium]